MFIGLDECLLWPQDIVEQQAEGTRAQNEHGGEQLRHNVLGAGAHVVERPHGQREPQGDHIGHEHRGYDGEGVLHARSVSSAYAPSLGRARAILVSVAGSAATRASALRPQYIACLSNPSKGDQPFESSTLVILGDVLPHQLRNGVKETRSRCCMSALNSRTPGKTTWMSLLSAAALVLSLASTFGVGH